jgi:hypothetical protein
MGRSNRPRRSPKREEPEEFAGRKVLFGARQTVVKRGVEHTVQTHSGASDDPAKIWVCPGCPVTIRIGTAHVVVWNEVIGSDKRRHFHTVCWQKFQGTLS